MTNQSTLLGLTSVLFCAFLTDGFAQATYRLYPGLTAYVNNPEGKDFDVTVDLRDINIYLNGPREVLIKVYNTDGIPVVREIIPDDGIEGRVFTERIASWDHQLSYLAAQRADGHVPMIRTSAFSDPARLKAMAKRTFRYRIKNSGPGIYRILIAGSIDHYVTLKISPDLQYAIAGHSDWTYGSGEQFRESYIYIPRDTTGLHLGFAEADEPRTRRFKLTAPDGKVLFDGMAGGGFRRLHGPEWKQVTDGFKEAGYQGGLLKLTVSEGENDFMVMMDLKQPKSGVFREYVGMGSRAVFAPDKETAMALRGGTIEADEMLFWHPFQVRFHQWLKENPLEGNDQEKALRKELQKLFNAFRLVGVGDLRGAATLNNLAYSFGYAGCKIWRRGWLLMKRDDVPDSIKAIIREGLILGGDSYSFVLGQAQVNGNSFTMINVALWYAHQATGDALQKQRFETFWKRWTTEGWGPGVGLSKSGDPQETFAHAWHYMSYIMNNWRTGGLPMYVEGQKGIIDDAKDDPRWQKVLDRVRNLFSYIYCREATGKGFSAMVVASPWSSRTHGHPIREEQNWEPYGHTWKGEPGPDLTVSVNGGDEWFAARRKNYYIVTFHGRITPAWVRKTFSGQLGFGGGMICHLTVPGRGPVITGNLNGWYGEGMYPTNWRNFRIHSIVGEMWDGSPLITGISGHHNAKLKSNVVRSSGEVREAHVRVARSYTFNDDSIECEVALSESPYVEILSLWSQKRKWSEVRLAYEMIPFRVGRNNKKLCTVTTTDGEGKELGELGTDLTRAKVIKIDRGGYGVRIELPQPMPVKLGANHTVMIQLTDKEVKAESIQLKYRIVPYQE